MTVPVTLDRIGLTIVLHRLAQAHKRSGNLYSGAGNLYARLMASWGNRPDRQRVTVKVGEQDLELLRRLQLNNGLLGLDVLTSEGWVVTYRHPKKHHLEVTVHSKTKPPKRRTFRVAGGKARLVAVSATRIKPQKEEAQMATKTKRGKKAVEEDELDELEGLEDLDELEDLEEDEEPEDEDEDEEDEDEEPAPRKRSRSKAAAKPAAKTRSRRKAAVEPEEEDEDEDEEDEPAPRKRSSAKGKAAAKPAPKTKAAASKGAAKSKGTAKPKGKSNGLATAQELPAGKVGPVEIAEMVGEDCDDRYVRVWLRGSDYKRGEGRWAFTAKQAEKIAKEIRRDR